MDRINLVTVMWNEEINLPHFIKYYSQFCDKIYFFDTGSDDKSREIIQSNPKCVIRDDYRINELNDRTIINIKNNFYKELDSEWVIVVDCDEFLYHPNGLTWLVDYLNENNYNVVHPVGYQMVADVLPEDIFDIKTGVYEWLYSKRCLFKKDVDINYEVGCHVSHPNSYRIKEYENPDLKLLHYKFIDIDFVIERKNINGIRLSEENRRNGWGVHNSENDYIWKQNFEILKQQAKKII